MKSKVLYKLTARCMSGSNVVAYMAVNNQGKTLKLTREQVIFLAGKKVIINCEAHKSDGKIVLNGKGINLKDLPTVKEQKRENTVKLVGRLMRDTKTIGYIVENNKNVKVRLSLKDVTKLAMNGNISNATIESFRGKPIIKGTDMIISELPAIDIRTNKNIKIRKISLVDNEVKGLIIENVGKLTELGKLEESSARKGIYEIVKKNISLRIRLNNIEDETYNTILSGSSIRASNKNELTLVICEESSQSILKINYKETSSGDITEISRQDFMKVIVASFIKAYKDKKIVYSIILEDAEKQKLGEFRFKVK